MDEFNDFIFEQELDEQESICGECGNLHSCSTSCWYDDDEMEFPCEN